MHPTFYFNSAINGERGTENGERLKLFTEFVENCAEDKFLTGVIH